MLDVLSVFGRRDRFKLTVLVGLIVVNAGLEVLGIGLLLPYVAVLQDPGRLTGKALWPGWFGIQSLSADHLILVISGALMALFVFKGVYGIWLQGLQTRFVYARQIDAGRRLMASYLGKPYGFFLSTNPSHLVGNLTTSLHHFFAGVVQSSLVIVSEALVLLGLLVFMIIVSPWITMLLVGLIGASSILFARAIRSRVSRYAKANDERWKSSLRIAQEAMTSAKEIQVFGRQAFFTQAYTREMRAFSDAACRYATLVQVPRVLMETAAAGLLIAVAVAAILSGTETRELFALLASFAVAVVRIVPSTNRIIQAWHAVAFHAPAIAVVRSGLAGIPVPPVPAVAQGSKPRFSEAIVVAVDGFAHRGNDKFGLSDVHFRIAKGEAVGIIGPSGGGKTTLVELMLGLHNEGAWRVNIDGQNIGDDPARWRRTIGYIPQSVFLMDDTIRRNIAFGLDDDEIDSARVAQVVTAAGLDAVISLQPEGLDTMVGDRGVRLSAGERQRIGIARALYHDPDILIMDEATSALDNETEHQIVQNLIGLKRAKTVIVIAHRLSTVENCDIVYLMREGRVADCGRFDEVAGRNRRFMNPAAAASA